MSSVRLHELRINVFNKLQDQTVRWNQGVVEESQDLHIIAVRDFIDQSSIFEAFRFVFGMENGAANKADVTVTIHRHRPDGVDVIDFNHTRVQGVGQNRPQSTFTIQSNNTNKTVPKDEYIAELRKLAIDAWTQLFLFGNGQFDMLTCPTMDLHRLLELHWFPHLRDQPSIGQIVECGNRLEEDQQLLRRLIRCAEINLLVFTKMGMWQANIESYKRDYLLLQLAMYAKRIELTAQPVPQDDYSALSLDNLFTLLDETKRSAHSLVDKLAITEGDHQLVESALEATTDDIKELNAFAQCNDQDTRDAYADCDEHYVEYFSANIDDWCNASRLQAEYDDMDTQKMLADIGAMLEEPMSGGRIAQEIAVAEASICTLDDDRSSHDAQSGTNAWEAAVEHDLEPFRYVAHVFVDSPSISRRVASLPTNTMATLYADKDSLSRVWQEINRDGRPIMATIEEIDDADDMDDVVVDNPLGLWRWQEFYQEQPYTENCQALRIEQKVHIENAIIERDKKKLLQIKRTCDQRRASADSAALLDRMDSNRTELATVQNRLHAQRIEHFALDADTVRLFEQGTRFGCNAAPQAAVDRKAHALTTQAAELAGMLADMPAPADIQTDLDGTLRRLQRVHGALQSRHANDGRHSAEARRAEGPAQLERRDRVLWMLERHSFGVATTDFRAAQANITERHRLTIGGHETVADLEIQAKNQLKRVRQLFDSHIESIALRAGYNCAPLLRYLKREQAHVNKTIRQAQLAYAERMAYFGQRYERLHDFFNAQVRCMYEHGRLALAPYLMMDDNPMRPAVYCVMGECERDVSTLYHQMAAIVLKAAILLESECPVMVIESYSKLFDRATGTAMLRYFEHLCRDEHMQVISMFVTPPNRLDDVSSVNLVWDCSSTSESVSDISRLIFNVDDDAEPMAMSDAEPPMALSEAEPMMAMSEADPPMALSEAEPMDVDETT